ncbi:hypothetical protein Psch_01793 [Pelotomaculum schinkii]|uniref:DUF1659 domain-containing protein n=1 Tax=Pelotomaculum schinkii TaxID=78350 RepID=A0A4Y7RGV1_9FIRM|nr:DUF1659 domain-containing protein [Pelotomaculum schinkii]TEB08238.1 hypothetical protein Psch_01793 [Pelotomaculum schinkii]
MAVNNVPGNSVLKLALHVGDSATGSPVLRSRSLNGIKPAAADQDLFDVATALAGLQQYPLNGITRVDNSALISA